MRKVNLEEKLSLIHEYWRPKVVAELNGQDVKLVKLQGAFVWHRHEREDELFLVVRGRLRVETREGTVELDPGEMAVVPRGIEHRTVAEEETAALLFEPRGTRNTGDVQDPNFTAPVGERV